MRKQWRNYYDDRCIKSGNEMKHANLWEKFAVLANFTE